MRRGLLSSVALVALTATAHAQVHTVSIAKNQRPAPGWVIGTSIGLPAYFHFDFANNRWFQKNAPGCTDPSSCLTNTRNTPATGDDCNGNWVQGAALQSVVTCKGFQSWEQRTNSLRDNTMQGAAVGTPGTLPNFWTAVGFPSGISVNVAALGTESGLSDIDIQVIGTPGSTATGILQFEASTQIAATYGQTWAGRCFAYLVAGATTNFTSTVCGTDARTSGGAGGLGNNMVAIGSNVAPLGKAFVNSPFTPANSTTAAVVQQMQFGFTNGQAVNATFRIGPANLENTGINSTVAAGAQTVANSGTSGCVSGTYTVSGGTGTVATLTGVAAGGVITSLTTLTGGSYTVFPPSPAALTGTGCSGSPTATLTPTNNAALAFPTPPILTTNAAVTRAADVTTFKTMPPATGSIMLAGSGTPTAPQNAVSNNVLLGVSDNAGNNFDYLFRVIGNIDGILRHSVGGTATNINPGVVWSPNAAGKIAISDAPASQLVAFNSVNTATNTLGLATGFTKMLVGVDVGGGSPWNGYETSVAGWLQAAPYSAFVQQITQ